jgi:hypothetical protein
MTLAQQLQHIELCALAPRRQFVNTRRSHIIVRSFTLGLFVSAAVGCAASQPEMHGQGAGVWTARLPSTQSPYGSLALGQGGRHEAELNQPVLLAQNDAARPNRLQTKHSMPHRAAAQPARVEPTPTVQPALSPSVVATALSAKPVAAPVQLASAEDVTQRYATREAASSEQQQFRGGDAIIISAGALVVVLLIVVLILLLR